MEAIGTLIVTIGAVILAYIVNGWALVCLWTWFVMPVFGVRAISIAEGIGLGVTAGLLTTQYIKQKEENWARLIWSIAYPIVAVFVGWIVRFFL